MNNEAKYFEEKINSINSSFLSALDNFKKYYIYYQQNPDVDEYSDNFLNTKNQLQKLSSNMFSITNNIETSIEFERLVNDVLNGDDTKISKLESLVYESFALDVDEICYLESELDA